MQYEGSGTSDRRFMGTDERGSVISLTDSSGTLLNLNRYDEYGRPQSGNAGRFQYTGQMWLPEAGLYHYKARVYLPHLGIFAQTDPIGYNAGANLYAYTNNEPINRSDPSGLCGSGANYYYPDSRSRICQPGSDSDSDSTNWVGNPGPGNGSNGGDGGGLIGGPYSGESSCTGCINGSDPRASDSRAYWGGYYDYTGRWIDTRGPSFIAAFLGTEPFLQWNGLGTGCVIRGDCPGSESDINVIVSPAPPPNPKSEPPKRGVCGILPSSVTYNRFATAEGAGALRSLPPWDVILGISSVKDGLMGEIVYQLCE